MCSIDNKDGQESDKDENCEIHCPFCKTTDRCDDLLLMVDWTFSHTEGVLLYDAFNALWSKIIETADDPDFDEMFEASIDGEFYDAERWAQYFAPFGLVSWTLPTNW